MLLCDDQIRTLVEKQSMIVPAPAYYNPASVDLTMGAEVVHLDGGKSFKLGLNTDTELYLVPGSPVLVTTAQTVNIPIDYAAELVLKSSMGRQGIDMIKAGWIDPGFSGQLTVTLYSHILARIVLGQPFVQMKIYRMDSRPVSPYNGKYQNQKGPTRAR